MSEATRQRIIEAGAELIHQRGFNNTGLQDILRAAGVPKGSFYFYFANKEAFGIELVDHFLRQFGELSGGVLDDETLHPLDRLRKFFEAFHAYFAAHDFARGCPIGNLAQEMSDLSPAFRDKLRQSLDRMTDAVERVLVQAQHAGDVEPDLLPHETAVFIIGAWHGAIIRMKVAKNAQPLNIFYRIVFDTLLK